MRIEAAARPLVLVFTAIAFAITIIFRADVDAQGGAYATGVLVLMSSAGFAVMLSYWRDHRKGMVALFVVVTAIFVYTTVTNIIERPEGIKIASVFIVTIVVTSLVSRALRSTELRVHGIEPDEIASHFITDAASRGEGVRTMIRF